jgi:hypothetical protein
LGGAGHKGVDFLLLGPINCLRPAICEVSEAIRFKTIPDDLVVRLHVLPQRERYDTEGDRLRADNTLEVRIGREVGEEDPRYRMLMFVHELVEALLCRSMGVTAAQVDSFDLLHQGNGEPGLNAKTSAPGLRRRGAKSTAANLR